MCCPRQGRIIRLGDAEAAAAAIGEARHIAGNLRCQPLLDQAANFTPAKVRSAELGRGAARPGKWTDPAGVIPAIAPPIAATGYAQNDQICAAADLPELDLRTVQNGGSVSVLCAVSDYVQ